VTLANEFMLKTIFQLVLQFSPWEDHAFDELIRLEEHLAAALTEGTIDGHDLGSGEANIFIFTERPDADLDACLRPIADAGLMPTFSAGYRAMGAEEYQRAWPRNDSSPFSIK